MGKECLIEISSYEEEIEDDSVEFGKKRVKKDVERGNRHTEENRSFVHKKKHKRKGLHKAKASNNGIPKAREKKVGKEVVKIAIHHKMVGESVKTIEKPINRDFSGKFFDNKRRLWLRKKIKNRDKLVIENIKRKLPPEKGDRTGKETIGGDDKRRIERDHTREENERWRSETGSKEEKTNGLLPLRFKA